jgi:hypothetical protein
VRRDLKVSILARRIIAAYFLSVENSKATQTGAHST